MAAVSKQDNVALGNVSDTFCHRGDMLSSDDDCVHASVNKAWHKFKEVNSFLCQKNLSEFKRES